jgi:hypothetical protein
MKSETVSHSGMKVPVRPQELLDVFVPEAAVLAIFGWFPACWTGNALWTIAVMLVTSEANVSSRTEIGSEGDVDVDGSGASGGCADGVATVHMST